MRKANKIPLLSQLDIDRFWSKILIRPNDCWEWQGGLKGDYGSFFLNNRQYLAHRVSYRMVYGDTDLYVCHHCDNPICVNPEHLFAGTDIDNINDAVRKGRINFNEILKKARRSPRLKPRSDRKLTDDNIKLIRQNTIGARKLGRMFGVSHSLIVNIRKGLRYKERKV